MLSFECIKNEKSVYFLLTSANTIKIVTHMYFSKLSSNQCISFISTSHFVAAAFSGSLSRTISVLLLSLL